MVAGFASWDLAFMPPFVVGVQVRGPYEDDGSEYDPSTNTSECSPVVPPCPWPSRMLHRGVDSNQSKVIVSSTQSDVVVTSTQSDVVVLACPVSAPLVVPLCPRPYLRLRGRVPPVPLPACPGGHPRAKAVGAPAHQAERE